MVKYELLHVKTRKRCMLRNTYCWEWKLDGMPLFLICSAATHVVHESSGTHVFSKVDWVLFGFVIQHNLPESTRVALESLPAIAEYVNSTYTILSNPHTEVAVVRFRVADLTIPNPTHDPDSFAISNEVIKAGLIRIQDSMLGQ